MAETEEVELLRRRARRRLVGAAAVVLFLVTVPPMLMDLEPKPVSSNLSVEIPPPPAIRPDAHPAPPVRDDAAASKDTAASGKSAPGPAGDQPGVAAADASAAKDAGAVKDAPPADAAPAKDTASAKDAPAGRDAPAAAASGGDAAKEVAAQTDAGKGTSSAEEGVVYVIPLGSFAEREHVQQLLHKARQLGVKVYAEKVATPAGERTRVSAGPYPSREAAEKARSALRDAGIEAAAIRRSEKRG